MEISFSLDASGLKATRQHVEERLNGRKLPRSFWRALVAGVVIGMLLQVRSDTYPSWFWGAVLAVAAVQAWRVRAEMRARRLVHTVQEAPGEYAITLTQDGLTCCTLAGQEESYGWHTIVAIETTASHLYFHLDREAAIVAPLAALAAAPDFVNTARTLWHAHPANGGRALPALPPIPETLGYQLLANVRQAVRVLLFLKFDPQSFRASWGVLAWLLVADACWQAVTDYIQALPMPVFNAAGLGVFGISLLVLLGWAAGVSGLMAQRATLLRLLVMAESAMLLINLVFVSLDMKLEHALADAQNLLFGVFLVFLLWLVAALARIIGKLYGRGLVVALVMGSAYALFSMTLTMVFPQEAIYLNAAMVLPDGEAAPHGGKPADVKPASGKRPALGATEIDDGTGGANGGDDDGDNPGDDGEDDGDGSVALGASLDVEDIYYRQPGMVRQALEGVEPRRPGETGLYFVGFAGDASEHEFGNEVRYARGLLDRRFNTAGRSLLLINSYDTVNNTPLANTHNMEAVLQGLAGRMDKNKDVLFLFLSSHGAQDHRLAVNFSPLEMNDLKAEQLKQMLDKSGIRNRVIVVSACYSGGFLDVLKDDNTLILTASRRDHVAYGCGDITQYTYFGEAYFVKALEHNVSFVKAFDEARNRIAAREKSEGRDSSGPQIHVGRNIGKVLQRLKVNPVGLHAKPANEDVQRCPENCPGEPG